MRTSEQLDRVADYIQTVGWKEGHGWIPSTGENDHALRGTCIEGAMMAVLGYNMETYQALRECSAYKAVREYLGGQSLWGWNDWVAGSQEQVIATLRGAAFVQRQYEATQIKEEVFA